MADSMLEPDFAPHYDAWKDRPGPQTAQALLQAVRPTLDSAVRSYGGRQPSPTLRGRAKLMALDAFDSYDPSRAKLRTHLMVQLQGLRRHAAREQQVVSVPERVALDQHRLSVYENELRDRLGRDPSDAEMSEHSGLSAKRMGYVRQGRPGYAEGTIAATTSGEESPGGMDPAVARASGIDPHLLEFVYHDMDPSDQVIVEHTLGLHGRKRLPKQEIALKLGISAGAVSQRAARIQERLNVAQDSWPLNGGTA